MKNILFLLIFLPAALTFIACKKNQSEEENNSTVRVIQDEVYQPIESLLRSSLGGGITLTDVDGYIYMHNRSFSNLNRETQGLVIASKFNDSEQTEVYPKSLEVNTTPIENDGAFTHPNIVDDFIPNFIDFGKTYDLNCTFSNESEFNSFSHYMYHPTRLNVTTNQKIYDSFDRTEDFQIEWNVDNKVDLGGYQELMFAYFAVPGNTVLFLPLNPKSGQATIASNEFASISSTEQSSSVGIIRVIYQMIEIEDKKLGLVALQDSRGIYDSFGM